MIKNRIVALVYRSIASAIILAGILVGSGFSSWPKALLFYTTQSNILSLCFLFYLIVRTTVGLIRFGANGCACYSPRLTMVCLMFISFTFIIFWAVLAPFLESVKLWTFGNLTVHAFCPILMLAEYILFCEQGHLRKKDVFLCALLPLTYVLISSVLGFCGVVFYYLDEIPYYFPYMFMDFNNLGWIALICIGIISIIYILLAWLFVIIDGKWKKPILFPRKN